MKNILILTFLIFFTTILQAQIIDDFSDGNFTSSPVWIGSTDKWEISNNSTAGTNVSGTKVLRLASDAAGTDYLSVQNPFAWGTAQTWAFWLGRRTQTATSANKNYIWLYANEANINSSTVDGYRIAYGDGSQTGDNIILEKVEDGVPSTVITSSQKVENGLDDYSFQIRITRNALGEWKLYTSSLVTLDLKAGSAAAVLTAATTNILQGTATDNTYTDFTGGYLSFAAEHSSGSSALEGYEYDNLKFESDANATLPVSLIAFNAKSINEAIIINWETSSEKESKSFELLRSSDGETYQNIAFFNGAGTSEEEHHYEFLDQYPSAGINYYQLLQTDFNGKTYTKTIAINSPLQAEKTEVWLTNSALKANTFSSKANFAYFYLYNLGGSKISENKIPLTQGINHISLPVSLNAGVYFFRFLVDGKYISNKIMKTN